jgi:S-DNA-T family DNA segregation ATPase FtsK/SpoIIIE
MARNGTSRKHQKKEKDKEKEDIVPAISPEALRGVAAVFLVALSIFLALAGFGIGGTVGNLLFSALSKVFGIGYMLLPLSLTILAVALVRSFERQFGAVQIASVVIFLLSGLGIINLAFPGRSGLLGELISSTLVSLLDTAATAVFLLAFIIAALIVAFNIHLGALAHALREFFTARPVEGDDVEAAVPIAGMDADAQEEDNDEELPQEEEQVPPAQKDAAPRVRNAVAENTATSDGGFPIIAARMSTYVPPPLSLLGKNKGKPEVGDVKANMNIIKRTLQNFGIQVEMDEVSIGPTVTRYAMKPAEGVRLSKIMALQSNLELALAASPVRIEAPIPGKSLVGVEVPNISRTTLGLAPLLSDPGYTQSDKPLILALGRSISGAAQFADLARMPHVLVAGTTGAGKSVAIHDCILSLLYRCGPERLRFIMVDPKRVELTLYNSIPHLLTPVITDPKKAIMAIKWLAKEMERRYNILETEKVRDISSYHENVVAPALEKATGDENETLPEAMPYIVVIIDELADIMSTYPRELEAGIVRLAQMSRAIGIHLILSTQRPSVKVITGLIKANVPARVAFQVASQIDSRTILDGSGAEKLLGAGDMLFLSGEMSKPRRIQAPYTSETEVKRVVAHIVKTSAGEMPDEINFDEGKGQAGGTDAIFASMSDDEEEDELYGEAKQAVVEAGKASTSYLQRKLGIGYARAARLIDTLEDRGVIGPGDGAKPREVIGAGNADDLVRESETLDDENEDDSPGRRV